MNKFTAIVLLTLVQFTIVPFLGIVAAKNKHPVFTYNVTEVFKQ